MYNSQEIARITNNLVTMYMRRADMVEREFEHYTQPEPADISYSNWQTVKQRTFSAPHRPDGSVVFRY